MERTAVGTAPRVLRVVVTLPECQRDMCVPDALFLITYPLIPDRVPEQIAIPEQRLEGMFSAA